MKQQTKVNETADGFIEEHHKKGDRCNISISLRYQPSLSKRKSSSSSELLSKKSSSSVHTITNSLFKIDQTFDENCTNEDIYCNIAQSLVHEFVRNKVDSTILACGQPHSGKTYTMHGETEKKHNYLGQGELVPGLMHFVAEDLFQSVGDLGGSTSDAEYKRIVKVSYVEMQNNEIKDLLHGIQLKSSPQTQPESVKDSTLGFRKNVFTVSDCSTLLQLIEKGHSNRLVRDDSSTHTPSSSSSPFSLGHGILTITIEHRDLNLSYQSDSDNTTLVDDYSSSAASSSYDNFSSRSRKMRINRIRSRYKRQQQQTKAGKLVYKSTMSLVDVASTFESPFRRGSDGYNKIKDMDMDPKYLALNRVLIALGVSSISSSSLSQSSSSFKLRKILSPTLLGHPSNLLIICCVGQNNNDVVMPVKDTNNSSATAAVSRKKIHGNKNHHQVARDLNLRTPSPTPLSPPLMIQQRKRVASRQLPSPSPPESSEKKHYQNSSSNNSSNSKKEKKISSLDGSNDEIKELRQVVGEKEKEERKLLKQIYYAEKKASRTMHQMETMQSQILKLQIQYERVQQSKSKMNTSNVEAGRLRELEEKSESDMEYIEELKNEIDQLQTKHAEDTDKIKELTKEIEALQRSEEESEAGDQTLKSLNQSLEEKLQSCNDELKSQAEETTKIKSQNESLKKELDTCRDELKSKSDENKELTEENKSLEGKLDTCKKEIETYKDNASSDKNENMELRKKHDALEEEVSILADEVASLKLEQNQFAQKERETLDEINALNDENDSLENEVSSLKSKFSRLEQSMMEQKEKHNEDMRKVKEENELLLLKLEEMACKKYDPQDYLNPVTRSFDSSNTFLAGANIPLSFTHQESKSFHSTEMLSMTSTEKDTISNLIELLSIVESDQDACLDVFSKLISDKAAVESMLGSLFIIGKNMAVGAGAANNNQDSSNRSLGYSVDDSSTVGDRTYASIMKKHIVEVQSASQMVIDSYKEEISLLKKQCQTAVENEASIKEKLEETEQASKTMNGKVESLETQIAIHMKEMNDLREQKNKLILENELLQSEKDDLRKDRNETMIEISSLNEQQEYFSSQNDLLLNQKHELKVNLDLVKCANAALESRIALLVSERDSEEKQQQQQEEGKNVKQEESSTDDSRHKLEKLAQERDLAIQKCNDLQTKLDSYLKTIAQLEEQQKKSTAESNDSQYKKKTNEEVSQVQDQQNPEKANKQASIISSLKSEKRELEIELSQLYTKVTSLMTENDDLMNDNIKYKTDVEALKFTLSVYKRQGVNTTTSNNSIDEITIPTEEVEFNDDISMTSDQFNTIPKQCQNLIVSLRVQLEVSRKQIRSLMETEDKKKKLIYQLNAHRDILVVQKDAMAQEVENLRNQKEETTIRIKELENILSDCQQHLLEFVQRQHQQQQQQEEEETEIKSQTTGLQGEGERTAANNNNVDDESETFVTLSTPSLNLYDEPVPNDVMNVVNRTNKNNDDILNGPDTFFDEPSTLTDDEDMNFLILQMKKMIQERDSLETTIQTLTSERDNLSQVVNELKAGGTDADADADNPLPAPHDVNSDKDLKKPNSLHNENTQLKQTTQQMQKENIPTTSNNKSGAGRPPSSGLPPTPPPSSVGAGSSATPPVQVQNLMLSLKSADFQIRKMMKEKIQLEQDKQQIMEENRALRDQMSDFSVSFRDKLRSVIPKNNNNDVVVVVEEAQQDNSNNNMSTEGNNSQDTPVTTPSSGSPAKADPRSEGNNNKKETTHTNKVVQLAGAANLLLSNNKKWYCGSSQHSLGSSTVAAGNACTAVFPCEK